MCVSVRETRGSRGGGEHFLSGAANALAAYGDEKVANRDIRVGHGATENGP
jgi:hypothetical protein